MPTSPLLRALPVLLVLLLGAAAQAQEQGPALGGTVSGVVVDAATAEPLATASVAVWQLPQAGGDTTLVTGAITGAEGAFRVEGLRAGHYRAVVSFVGYHSRAFEDVEIREAERHVDLGTVELAPDVAVLEGVEVQAERQQVQVQIDRTVYSTADDPASAGGSATNVLENIPSVDVDVDGNVSLRGSGNVAILINGRPAPVSGEFLAAYLQSLPAGSVDRVEVIPNPSARYDPEGMGGIINIVLKEDSERGLGGALSAGGDSRGGYNANATLSYGRGPWTLTGSYGLRHDDRESSGSSFRENLYDTRFRFIDQSEAGQSEGLSHLLNLTADYAFSRATSLTASAQLGLRDNTRASTNAYLYSNHADLSEPGLQYERLVEDEGEGWNTDLRLAFRHDFGAGLNFNGAGLGGGPGAGPGGGHGGRRGGSGPGPGAGGPAAAHLLTAEARFNASANDSDEDYTERLLASGDLREHQIVASGRDRQEASLKIDYSRPLGAFRLEAGYDGRLEDLDSDYFSRTRDSTGAYVPDTDRNNVFNFEQQVHALYGQVGREIGPVGLLLGLRAEIARTTFALENTGEDFENDYASLFPSAFLTYQFGEAAVLRASYSRRINRPWTWFLNPFRSYQDPLNVRQGNPALKPEYTDALELGFIRHTTWGSLTLSPYYRHTTDVIRSVTTREGDVTVRTFENLATSQSYGLEAIGAFEGRGALEGLRGYASLEGYRVSTDGTAAGGDVQNDAFGWGGRLNASYTLGNRMGLGDLDLQASLFYRAPMRSEQGRTGARTFTNLALRQRLLGNQASLSLSLRDPLGLAGFNYVLDDPTRGIYQESEHNWGMQQVNLTFTYTFGHQERRPQRERPMEEPPQGADFDEMRME